MFCFADVFQPPDVLQRLLREVQVSAVSLIPSGLVGVFGPGASFSVSTYGIIRRCTRVCVQQEAPADWLLPMVARWRGAAGVNAPLGRISV